MEIISLSLDRKYVEDLDQIRERHGFRSRSGLMRAAIDSLLNDYRILEEVKGHVDAVFTLTYHESRLGDLSSILARHQESIRTEIHQHHSGICLRVLIVCAKAEEVRSFFSDLKSAKGVRSLQVSVL